MRHISCPNFDDLTQCVLDSYSRLYNGTSEGGWVCVVAPYELISYILRSLLSTYCFLPYILDFDYEGTDEVHNEFIITIDKPGLLSVEPVFRKTSEGVHYIEMDDESLVYTHESVSSEFVTKNSNTTFIVFDVDEQADTKDFLNQLVSY